MGALKEHQPSVVMTTPIKNLTRKFALIRRSGFTLVELLVASLVAALLSTVTFNILIDNSKSNARTEFRRRLHEDWNRATTLIQSEIAMSDLIETEGLSPSEVPGSGCDLLQDIDDARLKLRMHLVGTLPEIIYGVRRIGSLNQTEEGKIKHQNQWRGGPEAGVLIRCGPRMSIGENGSIEYTQGGDYQQTILLDNIDLSQNDGLNITTQGESQKLVEFSLSMNENPSETNSARIRTKTLTSAGMSRINEVPPIPSDVSVCESICQVEDQDCDGDDKTLRSGDPRYYPAPASYFGTYTICTNRPYSESDGMEGTVPGNYVMDGNPTPDRSGPEGINLTGGSEGRNILLGTPSDDVLKGGSNHDALIGRGGNDELRGNNGNDSILPWSSTTQEMGSLVVVSGGDGFDRVYLTGEQSTYLLSGSCNRGECYLVSASNLNSADNSMPTCAAISEFTFLAKRLNSNQNQFKLCLYSVEQLVFKDSSISIDE